MSPSSAAGTAAPHYRALLVNSSFHGDFGRQIGSMRELKEALAEVARTHAGRPQPEVLAALERTISGFGLQPNHPDVDDQAQRISDGNAEQP